MSHLPGRLVVVDLQPVFGDPDSPWAAPRFEEVRPRTRALVAALGERVVLTRFVAPREPVGAWAGYDERALHLMGLHAPLVELTTTAGVLRG